MQCTECLVDRLKLVPLDPWYRCPECGASYIIHCAAWENDCDELRILPLYDPIERGH